MNHVGSLIHSVNGPQPSDAQGGHLSESYPKQNPTHNSLPLSSSLAMKMSGKLKLKPLIKYVIKYPPPLPPWALPTFERTTQARTHPEEGPIFRPA